MLEVTLITPDRIVFERCRSVIFPGENGVFEVLPFHKKLLARLGSGDIDMDGKLFPVLGGAVKVSYDTVTAIVEEPALSNES